MAKFLNNRGAVAVLAAIALFVFYQRIVAPFREDANGAPVESADYVEDMDDVLDLSDDQGIETVEQELKFVSAQYDLQQVSVEALHWNEDPGRDPFAPQVTIASADISAVQGKISEEPVSRIKVAVRQALPVVSAVVNAADLQYAVVDGEILQPGSLVGSYQLRRIDRDTVVFVDRDRQSTHTVRIKQ